MKIQDVNVACYRRLLYQHAELSIVSNQSKLFIKIWFRRSYAEWNQGLAGPVRISADKSR